MVWLASFPNTERWIFPVSHLPYWKGRADIFNCLYKIQNKNYKSFMLLGIQRALLKPKDSFWQGEFKHFHMDTSPRVRYAQCLHYPIIATPWEWRVLQLHRMFAGDLKSNKNAILQNIPHVPSLYAWRISFWGIKLTWSELKLFQIQRDTSPLYQGSTMPVIRSN